MYKFWMYVHTACALNSHIYTENCTHVNITIYMLRNKLVLGPSLYIDCVFVSIFVCLCVFLSLPITLL